MTARSDKPVRPWPRPDTSFDRYEDNERKANTDWLNAQLGITQE